MILLEGFAPLLVTTFIALLVVGLAVFLYEILRSLVSWIRSLLTAGRARSPEEQAVDDIAHYQGSFEFHRPGELRQRFAHRINLRFHNHWGCVGKWTPDDRR